MLSFRLSSNTLLKLSQGDLTAWKAPAGAIVNAANERMLGGGGVDGAIHRRAGPELLKLCYAVPEVWPEVRCPVGEARITSGETGLQVDHVIHTVGPIYMSLEESAPLLKNAYRSSLQLANEKNIEVIAFPALSCGVFGYPYKPAAEVAIQTCQEHAGNLKEVHFVLFEYPAWEAWLAEARTQLGPELS
mmetsp:Transcript_9816/g.28096  ORF Transcript_9816/g.28096 Transcript_9816/m.28096 type:complete len:189 (+) Transcript_9816:176-742(+)|eukprot:CAMPEP_0117657872 /NCGR_PEP_ID=MMETSP0804-20121206/5561_1 /TAXON_ID=1074897 /ORGANISM="Tetraselmis astigmatica, Strain CCMP880" /LENGTH=188 /DNA_ID=CAMNT_0005464353 /DNA_START=92 /DNA_END=658 /DNA_ORIENTATION=-